MIDLSKYIIHDLTRTYSDQIAGFTSDSAKTIEKDGWNATNLHMYSHSGTHMDAPFHFGVSSETIENFKPQQLMGKAWVIHVQIKEKQQLITVDAIHNIESKFERGDCLLIHTNWSAKILTEDYRNDMPRISEQLAQWCVTNRVKILGVEPPSIADVNNLPEVTKIHEILLGGDVIIVEGLKNLNQISKEEVFLIALPLKIEGGDGAPARVIALEEKQ